MPLLAARPGIAHDRIGAERTPNQIDACAQVLDSLGATSNDIGGRRRSAYPPLIRVGGRELRQIFRESAPRPQWPPGKASLVGRLGGGMGFVRSTRRCEDHATEQTTNIVCHAAAICARSNSAGVSRPKISINTLAVSMPTDSMTVA